MSESEGFDRIEPTEFHDMVPKHVTIKPRPVRPQRPFQWDCSEELKQQVKEQELQLQLTTALSKVDTSRADLRDARLRSKCLAMKNQHFKTQMRQLSDEKVYLRGQVDRLLNEVDMLRAKRLCVPSGAGEGVVLAQRPGASQTSCFDHIVSHEQDNMATKRHELSQSNPSSRKHLSSSKTSLMENCNQKQNVQKSKSFFHRFTKLFRKNKS